MNTDAGSQQVQAHGVSRQEKKERFANEKTARDDQEHCAEIP
jgi:hypothetical protein